VVSLKKKKRSYSSHIERKIFLPSNCQKGDKGFGCLPISVERVKKKSTEFKGKGASSCLASEAIMAAEGKQKRGEIRGRKKRGGKQSAGKTRAPRFWL